jgi:plasmid maintenance system antidote protein VapI
VRGGRTITADTALRLGEYPGTSAEMRLALQGDHDLRRLRADAWPAVRQRIRARRVA